MKMLKLLRVMKLKKLMNKFDEYIVSDSMDLMVTFMNLTIKILVIAHYMSCIFYYVGISELRANQRGWVFNLELDTKSNLTKYITSMYWAFTTMSAVGYGDITPDSRDEMLITIICMITSCGTFAYIVNRIGSVVMEFNKVSDRYKEQMMYVNKYMINKQMPKNLRLKIRRFLDYNFEQKKDIKLEDKDIYNELNRNLNLRLQVFLIGRILTKISFLDHH